MTFVRKIFAALSVLALGLVPAAVFAETQPNSIEAVLVSQQGGEVLVKVTTRSELKAVPANFSVAAPARRSGTTRLASSTSSDVPPALTPRPISR